ncbi:MAG TPA: DNA translocase FtsK [Pseudogracilibacillus sp.]|nr:DNA translocase FtsK [Pseudogracilibacillus sp.]
MAKKKKRKRKTSIKKQFKLELLGLLFIFLAIFGSGASMISDGFVPQLLENSFRLLFGIWYFIASILLLIIGVYYVVKRRTFVFLTKRKFGFFLIFLGVLLFTHIYTFERLQIDLQETSILKRSWEHFVLYIKGVGVSSQLGGGIVGALLLTVTYYLFSFAGAKIVAVFSLLIGLLFLTNLSFEQVINRLHSVSQGIKATIKERQEKDIVEEPTPEEDFAMVAGDSYESNETFSEAEEKPFAVQYAEEEMDDLVVPEENREEKDSHPISVLTNDDEDYELPSIELLTLPKIKTKRQNKGKIKETVETLEKTFESFGVQATITKAHVGPAVTRYEVYPEAGVKVSRILNLQDDLALALAAQDIRIEAPIPGKSAIGIEIPNSDVTTVTLREVLEFEQQPTKKLLFALGRDISGEVITGELNKMPHLLIAGATGSGKSVCINGIILSILMRAKPSEVKMMMIDPKKVELNMYNGIPHLLTPVVTDPKKASLALRKIVLEMDERYELFSETGTRNIEAYNKYIHEQNERTGEKEPLLPYIVVLIDELADLMMVASSDVEDSITRLAQMARAAGIHLIIATQRPSVDVITGVIKANIPSRIAFSVSSQVDSRTILDMAGAEKLLGRGDMLYIPVGKSKPIRVQGAFVSDDEVDRVVNHCKAQQEANYDETMIPDEQSDAFEEEVDELFEEAVQFVVEMQSASVSMLQRRFRIGYNRAARLIDAMEERGIVGPYEGNRPRDVLIESVSKDES